MLGHTDSNACTPCPPVVERVLGLALAEVARDLPRLAPDSAVVHQKGRDTWQLGVVHITLTPLPPRRLGALAIPRTRVHLDLTALPERERAAFMASFDRLFFRGGG